MCCTDRTNTRIQGPAFNMAGWSFPVQCTCGCLGNEQTAMNLHRYKEHLKAELKHVENRISQLEGCDQGKCDQ
jgi:hypothetical protein